MGLARNDNKQGGRGMNIYISLPITGRDIADVMEEAEQAAQEIRRHGHHPVSPLALEHTDLDDYPAIMGTDITALLRADAVMMMPYWYRSRGCRLERFAATVYDKAVIYWEGSTRMSKSRQWDELAIPRENGIKKR